MEVISQALLAVANPLMRSGCGSKRVHNQAREVVGWKRRKAGVKERVVA
jgi:hypothetical protein